jgi:AcrR family transcriptional regulator
MAQDRKTAKPRASSRKTSAPGTGGAGDPVDAMLVLVAEHGWSTVTLGRVAEACGLTLGQLYGRYRSKTDLLAAYAHRIDAAMLTALGGPGPVPADEIGIKDRLFEAIMARFDALAPHKAAVRVLLRELPADPLALACFLHRGLGPGIDWMLAAAELDSTGLPGAVRRKLVAGIYLDTLRVWLKDDSADLAATMAHLDKRLEQGLRWLMARSPFSHMREKIANRP